MDKPKILIIEDDELTRRAYEVILGAEGYQMSTATNGKEGLDKANQLAPNLILLDMLMPEMNGLEFLKAFQPKNHPGTKVLVLSNSASEERLHTAKELGAFDYMIKTDVKPRDIKTAVSKILGYENSAARSNIAAAEQAHQPEQNDGTQNGHQQTP